MIMFKERGTKEALAVWVGTWLVAFAIGGLLSQILI
jgi:ferrous iron transport protein B